MAGKVFKTENISFYNSIKMTIPEPTVKKNNKRKIDVALCKTLEAVVEGFSDSSDDNEIKNKSKSSKRIKKGIIKPIAAVGNCKQDIKKKQVEYFFVSPNSVVGNMVNNLAVKKNKNDVAIVDSSHVSITSMSRVLKITEPKESDQNIKHLTFHDQFLDESKINHKYTASSVVPGPDIFLTNNSSSFYNLMSPLTPKPKLDITTLDPLTPLKIRSTSTPMVGSENEKMFFDLIPVIPKKQLTMPLIPEFAATYPQFIDNNAYMTASELALRPTQPTITIPKNICQIMCTSEQFNSSFLVKKQKFCPFCNYVTERLMVQHLKEKHHDLLKSPISVSANAINKEILSIWKNNKKILPFQRVVDILGEYWSDPKIREIGYKLCNLGQLILYDGSWRLKHVPDYPNPFEEYLVQAKTLDKKL